MDKSNDMMGGPSANNSSDFVRKLYKMLEDPSHEAIVRWGEGGQSFVVLENEKFTKQILPKHFKHSNFASFVRQLNKYDFHKVRQNNEDNIPSPYGPNAWEFKHPEFQADKKDSLDNIRRKAPAPRKPTQGPEDAGYPVQQMDLLNNQFLASQQQLNLLTAKYEDLAQGHVVLLQQVVQLQKFVKAHDGVMHKVMGFLHNVDNEQRRNSRVGGPFANGPGPGMPGGPSNDGDHPASPLQQASELLERFPVENLSDTELTKMEGQLRRADYSTPPSDQTAPNMGATSAPSANTHINYSIGNDIDNIDNMVYPVGHTNGIDPVHSEHINNIPYALPANGMLHVEPMPEMVPDIGDSGQKKSSADSPWGMNKPRILLVEDDKVCARIGSKFLQAFECGVETARDGLEAVNKINNQVGTTFDLILMDIIMPHLDGVSATVCIREIRPHIPIIAMTSNIRADDIDMYFRYGMNDVLPKPFTKEGMLRALEKNLPQFRKTQQFPNQTQAPNPGTFVTPSQTQVPLLNMGPISAAQSLKEETSPGKSPVTASSWHSPNQLPSTSPVNAQGNYGNYTMTPTHQQQQQHHPFAQSGYAPQNPGMGVPLGGPRTGPHRRMVSDMTSPPGPDDHPDPKRQRMYPPPQGSFAQ